KKREFLEINQIVVYNKHQVHISKNTDIPSYDYYTLHFYDHWVKEQFSNIYFQQNILKNKNLYEDFINLCEYLSVTDTLDVQNKIKFFFNKISTNYGMVGLSKNTMANKIAKIVKQYILDNTDEQLTLEDISNFVGYNKEYIVRIFKKEYGLSPHAFLMNEKVNRAKNLLQKSSGANLSYIASEVGFYDQSHLSKFFKKSFALPPSKYQKSILYKR
ncbi:MAG: AraC family transcriptional regulator, partial [Campylobacterota bacterium]|nr:AraC family transcriptional regulator [Campylobacterota bacterium]